MCRTSFINKNQKYERNNKRVQTTEQKKKTVRKRIVFLSYNVQSCTECLSEKTKKRGNFLSFCLHQCLWILLICTSVYICNNHIQNIYKKCWHSSNNSSLKMRYYYEFLATVFFFGFKQLSQFTLSHENENYENLTN